jgi:NAD-dependent SIR2 family protein deacetylase
MATMSVPMVQSRLKGSWTSASCVHCKAEVEYQAPPSHPTEDPFAVKCASCGETWLIRPPKIRQAGKRRIGTGE